LGDVRLSVSRQDQALEVGTTCIARYANQNERDFQQFVEAVRTGRLKALEGVRPKRGSNMETRPDPDTGSAEPPLLPGRVRQRVQDVASLPDSPAIERAATLEVRWILPGQLEASMAEWFDRFPAVAEFQDDSYLLDPRLAGISVKIRSGRTFEVKTYRGSIGILDTAGRARGHMESWQKWSFPVAPFSKVGEGPASWTLVRKKRRISQFLMADGRIRAVRAGGGEEPGCAVELTEVRLREESWWTLGFEATGPASLLQSYLEATAALVFACDLPEGIELGTESSMPYVEWLCLGLQEPWPPKLAGSPGQR
jgi:hypothetical protein